MILIDDEVFFTAKEVANRFQVTMASIARWRKAGRLKSHKLNERKYLYSESSIRDLVKEVK
jgi:predicted site-specific integrase-resolvase